MRQGWATIAVLSSLLGTAVADPPGDTPAGAPAVAQPATDPPEVEARFVRAVEAFAAHRFAEATTEFEAVAQSAVEPEHKLAAARMAREARVRVVAPAAQSEVAQSHDGRYGLLIGTSVLGLGLYGPTLPELAGASGKEAVGLYMIGAATSFLVPYLLTRDEPVTWAMTDAWWYGSTRGALAGFWVLGLGHDPSNSFGTQSTLGALSVGSLAEGVAFTLWAREAHATTGQTNMIGQGGDFGTAIALGVTSLALPDDALTLRWASVTGLVGMGLGMGAGWYYGTERRSTWGDGEVMRAAGVLGAYAAFMPLIVADSMKNRQVDVALAVGGGLGGLVIGDRLLAGHHFSGGQGIVTELSMVAIAGAGAGLGYLISPSNDSKAEAKIVSIGAILGGVTGFALAYLGLDTEVRPDPGAPPISFHLAPDLAPGHKGLQLAGTF